MKGFAYVLTLKQMQKETGMTSSLGIGAISVRGTSFPSVCVTQPLDLAKSLFAAEERNFRLNVELCLKMHININHFEK